MLREQRPIVGTRPSAGNGSSRLTGALLSIICVLCARAATPNGQTTQSTSATPTLPGTPLVSPATFSTCAVPNKPSGVAWTQPRTPDGSPRRVSGYLGDGTGRPRTPGTLAEFLFPLGLPGETASDYSVTVHSLAWSPDARYIAAMVHVDTPTSTFYPYLIEVATGRKTRVLLPSYPHGAQVWPEDGPNLVWSD